MSCIISIITVNVIPKFNLFTYDICHIIYFTYYQMQMQLFNFDCPIMCLFLMHF